MIPARLAPYVISLFVSGGMSCMVCGLATVRAIGVVPGFFSTWMTSWAFSWAVAFPAMLFFRPIVTRVVMHWVKSDPEGS